MDAMGLDVRRIEQEAGRIQTGEDRILDELARLHERMEALEKQLATRTNQDCPVNLPVPGPDGGRA